jgi:acyl carrier protein
MEEKEAFERVKKVVLAQLGATPDSITMATTFAKDLGADPVDLIELEFALEEEFGIEIPDVMRRSSRPLVKRSATSRALFEAGFGKGNGAGGRRSIIHSGSGWETFIRLRGPLRRALVGAAPRELLRGIGPSAEVH